MQARDAVKPTILDEEEHARYLAALISGDAAAVRATEEQSAIIRQGGAPWIDGERRIWVRMPAWDHGGRSLLSDEAIQARIEGRPGPFKIEISKMTGRSVLFGFVYSLRVNPLSAWGPLMVFRQRDMQAFARNSPDWHAFAVVQPDKAASDARAGGLRPVATIIDTVRDLPESA